MSAETPKWKKASRSAYNGDCVEVANLGGGQMGIRDSKNVAGGHLTVGAEVFKAFVGKIKSGNAPRPARA